MTKSKLSTVLATLVLLGLIAFAPTSEAADCQPCVGVEHCDSEGRCDVNSVECCDSEGCCDANSDCCDTNTCCGTGGSCDSGNVPTGFVAMLLSWFR